MGFGPEIIRGIRLAAIAFAVGLISLVAYRMLDLDTDDEDSAPAKVAATPAPVKPKASGQGKFYPPPPPPLPGRAVAAKPLKPQGRDIVVVDIPTARESVVADASSTLVSDPAPAIAMIPPAVAAPGAVDPPPPPAHHNRLVRSVRKIFHLGK